MKLRAKLTTTVAATACMLAFAAPSEGKNLIDMRDSLEEGQYSALVTLIPRDKCDISKGEYWLKAPEKNGQYWETWCRDMDAYDPVNDINKSLKRVFWKKYPNGDPKKVQYTFSYDCTVPVDVIIMDIEGVYVDGCLGSWAWP